MKASLEVRSPSGQLLGYVDDDFTRQTLLMILPAMWGNPIVCHNLGGIEPIDIAHYRRAILDEYEASETLTYRAWRADTEDPEDLTRLPTFRRPSAPLRTAFAGG